MKTAAPSPVLLSASSAVKKLFSLLELRTQRRNTDIVPASREREHAAREPRGGRARGVDDADAARTLTST